MIGMKTPTLRTAFVHRVYMRSLEVIEAGANPLLDEDGDVIRDEDDAIIYDN